MEQILFFANFMQIKKIAFSSKKCHLYRLLRQKSPNWLIGLDQIDG